MGDKAVDKTKAGIWFKNVTGFSFLVKGRKMYLIFLKNVKLI